jgi:hypothetical protein
VRLLRLLVASVSCLLVASCGAEVPPAATVTIPAASPASSVAISEPVPRLPPPTPRKPNGDSKSGANASGDSVGVPECDEYIVMYERCVRKAGGAAAAAAETAFKAQREAFTEAASTPEGKAALKSTCKQMLDSLATNPMCK